VICHPTITHAGPYSTNPAWDGKIRFGREFNTIMLDGVDKSDLKTTCLKTGPRGWVEVFETDAHGRPIMGEIRAVEGRPTYHCLGDYKRKRIYGNVEYTPTLEAVPDEGEFDLENYPGYEAAALRGRGVPWKDVRKTLAKQEEVKRVVQLFPKESWQVRPKVFE
jgi:hypothetical protein